MIWMWLITLPAAAVQGATGFGFALIIVPLFALLLPSLGEVTAVAVLCSLLINMMVGVRLFRSARLKDVLVMALAALAGIPLGTAALALADPDVLKLVLGLVVALTGGAMLAGVSPRPGGGPIAHAAVGFVSGALNGAAGLSGPPLILFMSGRGIPKDVFRANMGVYGVFLNLFTLAALLPQGVFTADVGRYCAAGLPLTAAGVAAGMLLSGRIPERLFRRVTVAVVTALGLYTAVATLPALWK